MNQLDIAKKLLAHQGLKPGSLPEYLMDDKNERNKLEDHDERIMAHYNEDSLWTLKTVRFLKDFSRYGAGVHTETTNKSFLRTAELFRQMGIKNYYFLLQINNPLIKDLDPWSEDLTDEQRMMILNECNENIWYILREVIKIGGRRFRGNRAVISFIWSCVNHIPTTILMPRQSGKAQPLDSKIRTPDGWKLMGEMEVGSKVFAPDGSVTDVVGVYPQGVKPVYEFTFADGRTCEASDEHLWKVWDAGKGHSGKWRILTTLEIIERQKELSKAKNRLSIPLADAEQSKHKDFVIDPYVLGALIGDGCFTKDLIGFTNIDQDIVDYVNRRLPKGHKLSDCTDGKEYNVIRTNPLDKYEYRDKGDQSKRYIGKMLEEMGLLGKRSHEKFIPKEYLEGSHAQRLLLIKGLMDTDGTIGEKKHVTFDTSSKQLAEDMVYLIRSVGGLASIAERDTGYIKDGVKKQCRTSYRVNIRHREPWLLFHTDRKLKRAEEALRGAVFNSKLAIYDVKHVRDVECQCIEVAHKDHLYVTDNFVVTHNTVGMQVLAFIMQYLLGRGFRTGLITLAAANRMQFVEALKKIRAGLPEYLTNMTYKDKDAGNALTYQAFGEDKKNTFEVRVPSGGADGAENVSRGSTFEVLLYDEPAWTKYIENIINGSGPATLTAQKEAREKGIPYFTAKATTPNSVLKEEGRYMHDDFMSSTEWRESFFDSFSETHLVKRIMKASPVKTTYPKVGMMFTHLQLGFGHSWVKETMDKLGLSWSKAKIDLLMMWTEEGMNKLFDDFTREKLAESKVEHCRNEEIGDTGLFVDWFIPEEIVEAYKHDESEYLLYGMDTSDANDRDACTLVIRRMKSGEVVGTGRYALAFLDDVTDVVKELLIRIPNSMLVIERNRAAMMIERLLITLPAYGIDPFTRIFNDIFQDPVKYKNEYRDVMEMNFKHRTKEFYLRFKGKFGFHTGPETRRQMYGFIHEAISLTGAVIRYKLLIDELIGLEVDKDGRIDHKSSGHDDLVIAWLLTYWFIKLGYNKTLYGIPQGATMIEITSLRDQGQAPQYNKAQLDLFTKIRERINLLTKELLSSDNNTLAVRIEMEIRKLSELIPKELRKTITIDEIIENAKQERSKRLIEQRSKASRFGTRSRYY